MQNDLAFVRFDTDVFEDGADEIVDTNALCDKTSGIAFGASDLNQFSDKRVEAIGFALDPVERNGRIAAGAGEFDGDAEARERRTKLVSDVLKEPALRFDEQFDALSHLVDGAGKLAQFIAAARVDSR